MAYNEEYVLAALPLMLFEGQVVQYAKEEGMPGGNSDPRKSMDPQVMMIDIRRAWEQCEWLTPGQRQALLAVAMLGGPGLAAEILGIDTATVTMRRDTALTAMVDWLNSTYAQREAWEAEYS